MKKVISFKQSRIYDWVWNTVEKISVNNYRRKVVESLEGGERILDACSGTGNNFKYLCELYPESEITGVEILNGKILYSKKKCNRVNVLNGDITSLDFPNNHFDSILITLALNCVHDKKGNYEMAEKAVKELTRILKPGGRFVLWTEFVPHKDAKSYAKFLRRLETFINKYTNMFFYADYDMPIHDILNKVENLKMVSDTHQVGGLVHHIVMKKV